MSNTNVSNNGMNEAGVYNQGLLPGRCPVVRTHGPSRHQATVQKKWSTQDNLFSNFICGKSILNAKLDGIFCQI